MPRIPQTSGGQAAILSPDQLVRIWENLSQPHRIITQLCYHTASRVGEIVSLNASAVQGDTYVITQHKTNRKKQGKIFPMMRLHLDEACLPKSGVLFPAGSNTRSQRKEYRLTPAPISDRIDPRTGIPIKNNFRVTKHLPPRSHLSPQAVHIALKKAAELLDIPGVSTHSFRRSKASHLYRAGMSLREIMEITGHSSLGSLTKYISLERDSAEKGHELFYENYWNNRE